MSAARAVARTAARVRCSVCGAVLPYAADVLRAHAAGCAPAESLLGRYGILRGIAILAARGRLPAVDEAAEVRA